MELKPHSVTYEVELNEEESQIFQRKLPSDNSIQMFAEAIGEGNCTIEVDIYERGAVIRVILDFTGEMFFSDIKSEIKRIYLEIEQFMDES
jgi:hypothetical protein